MNKTPESPWIPEFSLSKKAYGLFRQFFAVCCAQNLFA